jgi:hypothetical protein
MFLGFRSSKDYLMNHSPGRKNTVKIKLEVEFPEGMNSPVTVVVGNPAIDPNLAPDVLDSDNSGGVSAPGNPAFVKVQGSGTSGVVCVNGTESPEALPTEIAVAVLSEIAPIPDSPTPDAIYVTPDSSGAWQINEVPGAACAWPATGVTFPVNCLVIWRSSDHGESWLAEHTPFAGQCSTHTDCQTQAQMLTSMVGEVPAHSKVSNVIDTTPRSWIVQGVGFRGEGIQGFNGTWNLVQFPQTAPGHLAWVAGGDSVRSPRVELFGQACGCGPFELRFSSNGATISYRFARDSWNPVGLNRSGSVVTSGLSTDSEFPGLLQIIPG